MAVFLKNLVARAPQTADLDAIVELIRACERAEQDVAESAVEDLRANWQCPDFCLATDAWVIVTTGEQIVGYACVWHQEYALISTFLCVDPAYRNRGIGTLLLRLVEVRARQLSRMAESRARVVLRSLLSKANQNEQRLFEHEGYQAGRHVLRVSFMLAEENGYAPVAESQRKFWADICLEQGALLGATPLYDRDGLCSVHIYRTYEKELRPAQLVHEHMGEKQVVLDALAGAC